jgi:poly(3-hydroxybutyrate) depolymerase
LCRSERAAQCTCLLPERPAATAAAAAAHANRYLRPFDQRSFSPTGRNVGLAAEGAVFVPPACAAEGANCKLHLFLHGCSGVYCFKPFSQYGGFNEWAFSNKMVVLYPLINWTAPVTKQEKGNCYDGYGQTGEDYDLKSGGQMQALMRMWLGYSHIYRLVLR